jgi:GNAT superfamily N-acetyltransferase
LTNQDILRIAMQQTAVDSNCGYEDLLSEKNVVVRSKPNENARRYLKLPFFCDLVSYGSNIVASVDERIYDFITGYINDGAIAHCFETPKLHLLTDEFRQYGKTPCFMAEYFLPDVDVLAQRPCRYELKLLHPKDFQHLYVRQWANALCEGRKHLDMLAVAALDGEKIVGLAACSADCDTMWQIGVDVLPEYRRQGVASSLTSRLAVEILNREKVPFYCCAWSNVASVRNALKSGFRPGWVHLTSVDIDQAMEMAK